MAGRHCTICIDPEKLRRTAELIAEGVADVGIAAALNVGRMSVHRHRTAHVLAPARAIATAAAKSRPVEAQRNEVVAAAEAGELDATTTYLALAPITNSMRRVDDRVERTAAVAEAAGHFIGVSALSGQQIRLAEMRAKLGGHGGYRNSLAGPDSGRPKFSVSIYFSNGHQETITATPVDISPTPEIDADGSE
jgi:hypothetical protein